jgi:hypothetical protein
MKMTRRLEGLKNTVNKYMTDIRPGRLTTCQSERKSVVSRRPHVGFVVDKGALGQVFSESIFIPPISPQSPSPIIRGWYNRPVVAAVIKRPTAQIKKEPQKVTKITHVLR